MKRKTWIRVFRKTPLRAFSSFVVKRVFLVGLGVLGALVLKTWVYKALFALCSKPA
jgi:hypothetical protein